MPDFLKYLNKQQHLAVKHKGRPLLILAGAGSGKTRVITAKIAYLIEEEGIDPRSILAVTFTNKAADEMRSRVRSLVAQSSFYGAEPLMLKTFHSFGAWLLRRYGSNLGLSNYFRIYDEEDKIVLLRKVAPDGLTKTELKRLAFLISSAKNHCIVPGGDLSGISPDEDFGDIYMSYQKRLRQTGNADFGDLILLSVELLQNYPDVRKRIQERFQVILVDEYQDSNDAQYRLLRNLYSGRNYICVVGDEDQSIYGFRGADIQNILTFDREFAGTEIIRLEQNYRSTEVILQIATSVVERNKNRLGKKLWTKKRSNEPVYLVHLEDQESEARFCAQVLDDGDFDDTAVIYRMNSQSRPFEEVFSRLKIPYQVIGSLRFYEREEIKDALSYLALLLNPRDEISFRRIINKPARGIGTRTLKKIEDEAVRSGADYPTASKRVMGNLVPKSAQGVKSFLDLIGNLKQKIESSSLVDMIRSTVISSGLYNFYKERDNTEGTLRVENLEEFANAGLNYEGGYAGLSELLEKILLSSTEKNPFEHHEKVSLITLHNTKGLEFERVIITGLEEGIFPHYSSSFFEDELEEERRLFYVGITRAKSKLYITHCRERRIFGRREYKLPSRFLQELPIDVCKVYDERDFV